MIVFPEEFLKKFATKRKISEAELEAMSLAVNSKSVERKVCEDIATELGIKSTAVRKRLSQVYTKSKIGGEGTGKLVRLQRLLTEEYHKDSQTSSPSSDNNDWEKLWKTVPKPPKDLYGRNDELERLEKWIVQDSYRMVAIIGVEGIGKTSLVAKLAEQIKDGFEYFLGWYSLRRATPMEVFLDKILYLFQQRESTSSKNTDSKISLLIEYLTRYRCLLVLDDVETMLNNDINDTDERARKEYEEYGKLLQRLGEESHQSCLILIGQQKPRAVDSLERKNLSLPSLLLCDLKKEDAKKLLDVKDLSRDDNKNTSNDSRDKLIESLGGIPLVLTIISQTIQEFGSIDDFLKCSLVPEEICRLLTQQFQSLSEIEKDLMYFLATAQEPVSLPEMQQQLSTISSSKLIQTMRLLKLQFLIEESSESIGKYNTNKFKMQCITNYLVEAYFSEIERDIIHFLKIAKEPVSLPKIQQQLSKTYPKAIIETEKIIGVMRSLKRRSLIQESSESMGSYMVDKLISFLISEKLTGRLPDQNTMRNAKSISARSRTYK